MRPDERTSGEVAVQVRRLPGSEGLPLPSYQTPGSAGLDLHAAVEAELVLAPGEIRSVPTGLQVAIPDGYEGQVRPRSGLALRHGLSIPNAPGTIDADYRGEVKVILINLGRERYTVRPGDRIAQLVFAAAVRAKFERRARLAGSERGEGGFGSTGT
jgi:dUTP pyrophosphatase